MLSGTNGSDVYQTLVEAAPQMFSWHSSDGKYAYVSSASQVLTGYAPEELLDSTIYDHVHTNDLDRLRKALGATRTQRHDQTVEYRFRNKDGAYVWLKTIYRPVNGAEKNPDILAFSQNIQDAKDIEAALQILAHEDQMMQGEDWFTILVSHLTTALKVSYAFITEVTPDGEHVRMLAFWKGKDFGNPYSYPLTETPCYDVIHQGKICYHPVGVQRMFPKDADLVALNAQGYLGLPVLSLDRRVIGHVAILDDRPLKLSDPQMWLAKIFAWRAGAELERLQRLNVSNP
jgi:PAS domain S-box-containing protein